MTALLTQQVHLTLPPRQCLLLLLARTLALNHVNVAQLPIRGLTTMTAVLTRKNKHHLLL